MASVQFGNQCYPDIEAATNVACSSNQGSIRDIGGHLYGALVTPAEVYGGEGQTSGRAACLVSWIPQDESLATIHQYIDVYPIPCQLIEGTDAAVIAWGIAAAWIAVFAVKFLRRAL